MKFNELNLSENLLRVINDMGFRDDMKTIIENTNPNRQACFFSAILCKEK